MGFSNILALDDELNPEERLEYIGSINKNSDLLLKLINDILELSRIESGYMSFEYEKCLVSDLIDSLSLIHILCIVCVVGDLEWENVGFEAKALDAMRDIPVRMISFGGSNYNISFLIRECDKNKALQSLSDALFNEE